MTRTRSVLLLGLSCLALWPLIGCSQEKTDAPKPVIGGSAASAAPTSISDALNNPNVPESAKAQMRGMQGASGKR
jgi:hypothetical protein